MDWLAMQLADSAFPAGGFAHSAGMEAASQLGDLRKQGVEAFVPEAMWQAGYGSLPLVGHAHREPGLLMHVEAVCDAFLTSAVANRASRTQGRALASVCARTFGGAELTGLYDQVRARRSLGHHAPLFGAVARALGIPLDETQRVWMHVALRGVLSAAVRLGLTGAHQAQSIHRATTPLLDRILAECDELDCEAIAQTAPRLEITASQHHHLYSRLFQS